MSPRRQTRPFATIDARLVFDTDRHTLEESTKSLGANVYIQVPHRSTDVVDTWATDQVQRLPSTSFDDNDMAFICHVAAYGTCSTRKEHRQSLLDHWTWRGWTKFPDVSYR